jgi:hypothetical protein
MGVYEIDNRLDGLTYCMRHAAPELIAKCAERRVPVLVLETLRNEERLEWLIEAGKSWSRNSYHLPGDDGLSAAMDAAPILRVDASIVRAVNWDPTHRQWAIYLEEAERLGLECGARWKRRDWSHVQLQRR